MGHFISGGSWLYSFTVAGLDGFIKNILHFPFCNIMPHLCPISVCSLQFSLGGCAVFQKKCWKIVFCWGTASCDRSSTGFLRKTCAFFAHVDSSCCLTWTMKPRGYSLINKTTEGPQHISFSVLRVDFFLFWPKVRAEYWSGKIEVLWYRVYCRWCAAGWIWCKFLLS